MHVFLRKSLRRYGKFSFISRLKLDASILDVGCGNDSPYWTKQILPNCFYTGIDIADYGQAKPNLSDNYIVTTPEKFASDIATNKNCFDAVISAHNLEHCDDREKTLQAIMGSLKKNGLLYLAFPSESSVNYPSRGGCLCYYDDPTHKGMPPDFDSIIEVLHQNGFEIIFLSKCYKPLFLWIVGLLLEPYSRLKKYNSKGTWAYYGFEAIIWARKRV